MKWSKFRVCSLCGRHTYKKPSWGGVICPNCWKANTKTVTRKNKYKYWGG